MPAGRPKQFTDEERLVRNAQIRSDWRRNHPEKVKEYHAKYSLKPEVKERKHQWAIDNKEAINARRREIYRLKRIDEEPPIGQDQTDTSVTSPEV